MTATPTLSPIDWARARVEADEEAGLLRTPRRRVGGSGVSAEVDGRRVVVLSGNDYLGLSVHPAVREAAAAAARELGAGATGSRHLSGCHEAIEALEGELAAFEGAATATLAPTGYAANLAVLQALGGPDAVVFSDERNHASIVDGCRLSRARVEVFAHRDVDDLRRRLRGAAGRPVIVSDSVFSMDGTVADVDGLAAVAREFGAWLVLDEAHATGVLGPDGRGATAAAGVDPRDACVVRVVTLSKALGAGGGAVCGDAAVRRLLLQRGRALIFSTALPHPTVAAARAGLAVLRSEPALLARLHGNARLLRGALGVDGDPAMPIVPVVVGEPGPAVALERAMLEAGFLVQAVRPPTVAVGTSRVRMVASALHDEGDLLGAAGALRAWREK
ncbi:MAG TPA: 8-amino-7-oxononanoate synthase [Candidatus Dormibacteraeota bacterium]|jgi:glycine C-acetyltransferase/8-amino-7-oxononanoate synthase|nr:8-amino-7-oxononanoate synthase [Candidatus Dormibacteraeota bacterium]